MAQRKTIFKEDFESYENNWLIVDQKEFTVRQDSGKLYINKATKNEISNGCLWYRKTITGFNADKNFSISFDGKSISSEFNLGCFDFSWGRMHQFDGVRKLDLYNLDFRLNRVRLGKFQLGKGWEYFQWSTDLRDSSLTNFDIQRNVFNKFEIIQQDEVLMVKINNKLIYKLLIKPQVGSEIGFQQCIQSSWELDNIVIGQ